MPETQQNERYGYTLDGDKRRFLKVCNLCMRADVTLVMMSGFDELGTCEQCGKEDMLLALVKCTREE